MKLERNITIRGETDFCNVSRLSDGRIQVGSITLKDSEVPEFGNVLAEAVAAIEPATPTQTPPTP